MYILNNFYKEISQEVQRSEGYNEVKRKFDKLYEKVLKLIPDEKKLLDELCFQTGGLEYEHGKSCFREGFKCALMLVAECVD